MGIKHTYQTATANNGTPEVSSTRWNQDHQIDSEVAFATLASDPAVAASAKLNVFSKKFAQASFPAFRGESGIAQAVQSALWGPRFGFALPTPNAATLTTAGMNIGAIGTATLRNNGASGNMFNRARRHGNVSAAAAGSLCGWRQGGVMFSTGDGTGLAGFFFNLRCGCADPATVAGARQFLGVGPNGTPTNVEPNTLINCIGVGHGAADTTLSIYFGGTAAQTPIALGANFPANTLSTDIYELTLYSPSDATGIVYYRVERVNTGDVATGTLSGGAAVLPTSSVVLTLSAWRCNNATALACALDFMSVYFHTEK